MVKGSVDMITTLIVINEYSYIAYIKTKKRKEILISQKEKEKKLYCHHSTTSSKVKYPYIDICT